MKIKFVRLGQVCSAARARLLYTRPTQKSAVARVTSLFLLSAAGLFLYGGTAAALNSVQGYKTNQTDLIPGFAVQVLGQASDSGDSYVGKTTQSAADKVIGVVVDPGHTAVAVTSTSAQVYVATTGVAEVYVTDFNGTPKAGNLLVPSPMEGVLMVGPSGAKGVLGVALDHFPDSGTQSVTITGLGGKPMTSKVGLVRMNMDVKSSGSNISGINKNILQQLADSIVHKEVSTAQAVIALAILVLLLIVGGSMLYASISGSVNSLGRNPYAKGPILRGMLSVGGLVILVLILGVGAIYLVLWL